MATYSPTLTSADDERDQTAGLRIQRQMALFVAVGYLAYAVVTLPAVTASLAVMDTWWTVLALLLVFGTGIVLGPLSWRASARQVKMAAGAATAGYLIAIGSWWFGWNGQLLDGSDIWFSMFCGLAALAAAIALRPGYAFTVLCVVVAATVTINHTVRVPQANGPLLPDMAWAFAFSLIYFAAAVMATRTAAVLDSTRAQAYTVTAEAAAAQARTSERLRFAQLTHDEVMTTLLAAARHGASVELAQHARRALAALDESASIQTGARVSVGDAIAQIRAATGAVNPQAHFRSTIDAAGSEQPQYLLETVRTLAAAAAEAVRNSRRHAGPTANTWVSVTPSPGRLCVEIVDDGAGFDPRRVPAERLGIAVSIRGRMAHLAGGAATITSRRGDGTRVLLEWSTH
ncbi:sensor histidine kinase [Prescottella agglutinans]|jgi:signal transduction histidine kinase|uniref:Signal transduction histidine kinase n=1 Tax=Prescottella agglutinans TaxID=1644129 RepID=A0ABT6MKR5_9NOCA|nr:ATP-binding protein [Prescottella agglutinans]MDH6284907.1 signal transduction histidine kinase [Prescottella agglutinans]